VTSQTDLLRPAQFADIVIRTVNGFPVKMRDVARVEEGADERSAVRLNGRDAISAGVIRQATANPLELSRGVRAMLPKLQGRTCRRHHDRHRQRQLGVHRPLGQERVPAPSPRRWCWWRW
jgi:multidrug efflux pump subunit AcrB